jgi:fibronectin-binding autotransporter adhesin
VSGSISGTAGLTKGGTGEVILSGGANTYSGTTTVSAGTLTLANRYAVQNSTVIMGGGTGAVVFDSSVTANAFTFGGLAGAGSGAGYDIALQNNDSNTPAGITLTVGGNNANTAYAGVLSGAGRLTKAGAGTLTLSNAASTYTGATTINAGTLEVSKLANGGSPSNIGASGNDSTNLVLGNGTTLRYKGAEGSTDRQFRFNGNLNGLSITLDASGTGPINFTSATGPTHSNANQTRTLNLIGSNTGENTLAANIGNNGSGALSVVKDGPGTWILAGANTYTGATTVNAGTLLVNNSTGTGTVTVNAEGTIGGYGTIGGAVTVNAGGTVAPGGSVGALTANGNVVMGDGSIYEWQLAAKTGTPGTHWDLITAASINLTGLITFKVDNSLFGGLISPTDGPFVVANTTAGTITSSAKFTFILPDGWKGGKLALSDDRTSLILSDLSCMVPGDTNGDQVVDTADYVAVKQNLGLTGGASLAQGNLDGDGDVDWDDLQIVMTNFGTGTSTTPATTPEPATLGLLAIGALAVLRRRRS